jgi:uncharacterized membrane protein
LESNLWLVYAVVTTLFWGVWGAFIEAPEKRGFPATLGYVVWSLTMIPCALVALAIVGWQLETDLRSVLLGSAAGLLGAAGQLVLFQTLRRGPAYLVFPVVALSPVVSVGLSVVLLGESARPLTWLGIVLALLALPLLAYQPPDRSGPVKGYAWLVMAISVMFAWGIQAIVLRYANETMRSEGIFFYMTVTAVALAPVAGLMTVFKQKINWGPSGPWLAAPNDQRPRPRHHHRALAAHLPGDPAPGREGGHGAGGHRVLPAEPVILEYPGPHGISECGFAPGRKERTPIPRRRGPDLAAPKDALPAACPAALTRPRPGSTSYF